MNPERYSRQILFPGIGQAGQKRIATSRVVIIGCGALGAMQAEMLARAGVGRMRLVDRDFIEESNLQRQIMFDERDLAKRLPKAIAAARHIGRINSEIEVEGLVKDVNYSNIIELIEDVDLILDGTDNFETRYLINDAAVKLKKPWIYGAAVGSYGVQMTIQPYDTPCLSCIFPQPPAPGTSPTCDTAGVILPAVATVASYQVSEALKILTGKIALLHGSLLQFDLWENRTTRIKLDGLRGHGNCRTCEQNKFDHLAARAAQLTIALCGRSAVQVTPPSDRQIDLAKLAEQLRAAGEVSYNRYLLKFKTGDHELTVFPDARSIIKGTDDPNIARSLYARYIGA
jgi:molybdopterin/thiamine biosynthesis adenylyltransferase